MNRERLLELLYYDETSPTFLRWKIHRGSRALKDHPAGSKRKDGYYTVRVDGKLYLSHRVIWDIVKGLDNKSLVINHIDNNPSNNSINNLELCTHKHNSNNMKMHTGKDLRSDNVSGYNGIIEINNGTGNKYVQVSWKDPYGKTKKKYFSYTKLGKEQAWNDAINFKLSLE